MQSKIKDLIKQDLDKVDPYKKHFPQEVNDAWDKFIIDLYKMVIRYRQDEEQRANIERTQLECLNREIDALNKGENK